ncbi:MAG: hypothetical protein JNK05_09205 [Myxococcales bacterium]|nr:hypothetical protein [Myxococcales bacterium]
MGRKKTERDRAVMLDPARVFDAQPRRARVLVGLAAGLVLSSLCAKCERRLPVVAGPSSGAQGSTDSGVTRAGEPANAQGPGGDERFCGLRVETSGEVGSVASIDDGAARAWAPTGLRITASSRRLGDAIETVGVVRNESNEPRPWVYLTGGEPPSTNPMQSQLVGQALVPSPPRPRMEVYPAPMQRVLQPGSEVRYRLRRCQSDYVGAFSRPLTISWSVEAWGAHRVTGQHVVE